MNEPENYEAPGPDPQPSTAEDSGKRHFDSLREALQTGKDDACSKAKEAAPKLKEAMSEAVFEVAYGAAYGAVFVGAFATELVPKSVRDGIRKGAEAGRDAARKARERVKEAMRPSSNEEVVEVSAEPVVELAGEAEPSGA